MYSTRSDILLVLTVTPRNRNGLNDWVYEKAKKRADEIEEVKALKEQIEKA